ncbi:hypothetical protein PV325_009528 [Microctonus aethiopoides]|nr:hypothetical protein PV325_009528 [Microctonus aethiopoides]
MNGGEEKLVRVVSGRLLQLFLLCQIGVDVPLYLVDSLNRLRRTDAAPAATPLSKRDVARYVFHPSHRGTDKTTALLWITQAQFTADTGAPVRAA